MSVPFQYTYPVLGFSLPCSTVWVVISVVSYVRRFTGVVNTSQFTSQFQQYLGTAVITEYLVVNQSEKNLCFYKHTGDGE